MFGFILFERSEFEIHIITDDFLQEYLRERNVSFASFSLRQRK